jgi:small-conductance mechanosensitive channel
LAVRQYYRLRDQQRDDFQRRHARNSVSTMPGLIEVSLLVVAAVFIFVGWMPPLRSYRSLLLGAGVLTLMTALFPRPGNALGQYLFTGSSGVPRLPSELFGIIWWILGAWLVSSLLGLVLRRTAFPDDNEPHARRLFADMASVLVYVVALVGIMDTVLKQPISAVLATSGVLAIVLGLALQNTLADVFSGLALNIERPFRAGEWITIPDGIEGQVMEINWRATRIKTASNNMVVIPNSVISKATITNHRRLNEPHICTVMLKIDHLVPTACVIDALQDAAKGTAGIALNTIPTAYASDFNEALIAYGIDFAIDKFTLRAEVQSVLIKRVTDKLRAMSIAIGRPVLDVRIIQSGADAATRARSGGHVDSHAAGAIEEATAHESN